MDTDVEWLCHLCTQVNQEEKHCQTCGRPREYVSKCEMDPERPKAMLLHGNDAIHFRPEQVQHLIDSGYDLNCRDSQGWTPLLCAVRAQALDVVKALLKHETVDKEAQTREGWRALHYAVTIRNHDLVQLLLVAQVETDARIHSDGQTAAHLAAKGGDRDILHLLASFGANLNLMTVHLQQTPLHLAVLHEHEDLVKLLLEHHVHVHVHDLDHCTALDLAVFRQHDAIQLLLQDNASSSDGTYQKLIHQVHEDRRRNARVFYT